MAATGSFSPAARSLLQRGYLLGGVILAVIWLAVTVGIAGTGGVAAAGGAQILLLIFSAPAATLLGLGLLGERAGRRFEAVDRAYADAVATTLADLRHQPRTAAYPPGEPRAEVRGTWAPREDRPADAAAIDAVETRLNALLHDVGPALTSIAGPGPTAPRGGNPADTFATALRGLAGSELTIGTATREHLASLRTLGVATGSGPAIVRLLPPAVVESWIHDLVNAATRRLGGASHLGDTVLASAGDLIAHFGPPEDPGDRLGSPFGGASPVRLTTRGLALDDGTCLATAVEVTGEESLLVFPAGFPALFGQALGEAARLVETR